MTVLNFPSTAGKPTDGSFQYIANGVVYSWDGEKWVSNTQSNGGGGGRSEPVHFDGPDAPDFDSLIAGDQWYNTNDGRLYTYTLNDNNDLVWVDASPDSQVPQFWERTGTTLEPTNDGDSVTVGVNGTTEGVWIGQGTGGASKPGYLETKVDAVGQADIATFRGQVGFATIRADGSVNLCANKLDVRPDGTTYIGGSLPSGFLLGLYANGDIINNYEDGQPFSTIKATTNIANFNSYNNRGHNANTRVLTCSYNGTAGIALAGGGNAYKPSGGSWSDISDVRMKSNLADYTAGLAEIKQLQPKTYDFHGREHQHIGFVAQDLEGVMPEMVSRETGTLPDGTEVDDLRTVNITAVHYAAVNAIKEMAARIEDLEAKVQQLEGGTN